MTIVERHPAADRTVVSTCTRPFWTALLPLWERCEQGWFVYGPDGHLAYANPAVASLVRCTPRLGSSRFVVDIVPSARRALEQRWSDLCAGRSTLTESLFPVDVAGTTCAMHLTMVALDTADGRVVVGTLRRPVLERADHDGRISKLEVVLGQVMNELLAVAPEHPGDCSGTEAGLSARQREVMQLLAAGESTSAIAVRLSLSPHTVRNHTKAVFRALGVHSQTELIHRYRRSRPAPTD